MTELDKVVFVVQFDCLDDEINSLYSLDAISLAGSVLDATPLGERIEVSSDEEAEYWLEGDVSLHNFEDYAQALKGFVRYSTLNVGFEGNLDGKPRVSWSELRQALLELRKQRFENLSDWHGFSSFDVAPVSMSLEYLKPCESEKLVRVKNENNIAYLDELEAAASAHSNIASFMRHFETEIASYREGSASRFLISWFSTELLLTQLNFEFEEDPSSAYFLRPVLDVEKFDWAPGPVPAGVLLEGDRQFRKNNIFWVNPLPTSPYREGSDWDYTYQDAISESLRRGATGSEFKKISFAMTMWYLAHFVKTDDQEETALNIGEFLERHRDDLESLLELMDGSEFSWQLEDYLSIPSALHSFLQSLPLPENAREIWADYLTLIGVDSD